MKKAVGSIIKCSVLLIALLLFAGARGSAAAAASIAADGSTETVINAVGEEKEENFNDGEVVPVIPEKFYAVGDKHPFFVQY